MFSAPFKMHFRGFLWSVAGWIAASVFVLNRADCSDEVRQGKAKMNFIVLLADDMGFADPGFMLSASNVHAGQSFTPNLDALAVKGVRLLDFHSAAATCSPSRASLLTGRLGIRNGVVRNFYPSSVGGLPLEEITLPELLKEANYSTGMIGKWHLGLGDYHPVSRGFSYYFGVPYSVDMGCTDDPGWNKPPDTACDKTLRDAELFSFGVLPEDDGKTDYLKRMDSAFHDLALPLFENREIVQQPVNLSDVTRLYADKAVEFINRTEDPFFLYVAFGHVHVPLGTNSRFANASGVGPLQDTLLEMDDAVGKIVAALKERGLEDNTLIWFASDNGPWEVKCDLAGSAAPFDGVWQRTVGGGGSASKMTVWEGGHRVPGFIYHPSLIEPGFSADLLSTLDIFPTILSLAGVSPPSDRRIDGIDLWGGASCAGDCFLQVPGERVELNLSRTCPIGGRNVKWCRDFKQIVSGYKTYCTPALLPDLAPPIPWEYTAYLLTNLGCNLVLCLVLFHPNSCAAGEPGEIGAVRFGAYKGVFYSGGSCPDCENKEGPKMFHDPPLVFHLADDPGEVKPVPDEGGALGERAKALLDSFMADVAQDKTHTADFSVDPSVAPCCNPAFSNCRCSEG